MKWIKNRTSFINEAKIRDVIFPRQAKQVADKWGEKYLDYEEVVPTDKIKQGKWKLSNEDKIEVLNSFFQCNIENIYNLFKNLSPKFGELVSKSLEYLKDADITSERTPKFTKRTAKIASELNINNPSLDELLILGDNIFRKLDINQTKSTEFIKKGEDGRPIIDEDGNMVKIEKPAGEPIFTNNYVNFTSFISDYNRCYDDDTVDAQGFEDSRDLANMRNLASSQENSSYSVDFEIFNRDLYLSITHNPKDILNMSISKFYSSCQHLYSGSHNNQLLGNVFDTNSIPAFLVFDTPIYVDDAKISEQLPLSRMVLRSMESFDDSSETKIFFDRAYTDRMKDIFNIIVEKYSKNVQNCDASTTYIYSPDLPIDDSISTPYMDRLSLKTQKFIGINTKKLYLNQAHDWTKVKISPDAKIEELIIDTVNIPTDIFKMNLNLKWVKFKFIEINDILVFDNVKSDSYAFEKCKFDSSMITELISTKKDIKKLQITNCDIIGNLSLNDLDLEEIHLIYTLDSDELLESILGNLTYKKLIVSGDLLLDKENKKFLKDLKRKGVKVEIVGLVL